MNEAANTIQIAGIGTAVPEHRMDQEELTGRLLEALHSQPAAARWAKRLLRQSGVQTRYTCDPSLLEPAGTCRYWPLDGQTERIPTTAERMAVYKREAVPLGAAAAAKALTAAAQAADGVTHLITVSCTGQFLPGLDVSLVGRLGLRSDVRRIPLTFLGCAAGLRAIALARELAASDPETVVLVACVELCTLHIQPSVEKEALLAASFFGDGASSCVVRQAQPDRPGLYALGPARSALIPDTSDQMIWEVGNHGFDLYLSPSIPRLLARSVPQELERLSGAAAAAPLWAIHPGGRGIVDALQQIFGLTDTQVHSARTVLQRYGNLSSATILFVLQELLQETRANKTEGTALAFGPGLTAELMQIVRMPSAVAPQREAVGADA
ncbi:type III polyketide synthase [Paenibacillus sp. IB182496]|uniref:Type III polyketide synthase n=1 Tax=Paenibacillus sabuli TaxID=2772509 RepID=A0A927GTL6_9BACL|nr:type III polyketide synthase [Paenibacillus sabuli]MBD2847713.1 type III polyketide synthase [Paenibacillus sabuli]